MGKGCCYVKGIWTVLLLLVLMLASGCGGGGQEGIAEGGIEGTGRTAEGGIEGTGRTIGPISGFGSVHLNGIRFDTTNTLFTVEGNPGTEEQLFQGMVVTVSSDSLISGSSSFANTIDFRFNLIGSVDSIINTNSFKAVGQSVLIESFTVLRGISLDPEDSEALITGDIVAFSGFLDAEDQLVATYLEKLDPTDSLAAYSVLEGEVKELDWQAFTFKVGDQLVDYTSAVLINFTNIILENGLIVRIKGQENIEMVPDGVRGYIEEHTLIASSVSNLENILADANVESVRLQGIVRFISGDIFTINDLVIRITPDTSFPNGNREEIAVDNKLLISGTRNGTGEIVADEIMLDDKTNISVEANIEAIDITSNEIVLAGLTAKINGLTFHIDYSPAQVDYLAIEDLNIDDRLRVHGFERGERSIIVSRLERLSLGSSDQTVAVRGNVGSSISDPLFTMAGLPIDTEGLQDLTGFFKNGIVPITREDFFTSLQLGDIVRVIGVPQSNSLKAAKVSSISSNTLLGNMMIGGSSQTIGSQATLPPGSNFIQFDPNGDPISNERSEDYVGSFDDSLICTASDCTDVAIELSNPGDPFFGLPIFLHDARVFGPGTYTFDTTCTVGQLQSGISDCNNPLGVGALQTERFITLTVAEGQLGAHMLMDWAISVNVDIVMLWNINDTYSGGIVGGVVDTRTFDLASKDVDGDGIPGARMVDGPFLGFSFNFNLFLTTQ